MEHEVFVPVPVPALRRTLADPARVARCVPGFQQDADSSAGPLAGRLKFRAGGHTITYRGALALRPSEGGDSFSVSGEGAEARGGGSAKLALTIGLTRTDGGTTIGYSGTARGEGRIVDLDVSTALTAAQRLLDRFTQQLVTESLSARSDEPVRDASVPDAPESGAQEPGAPEPGKPESDAPEPRKPEPAAGEHASDAPSPDAPDEPQGSGPAEPSADKESVFDSPVPPPSLDPSAELEFTVPDEPPAEAAHARRTMIGRSTEEVDHAPPRGRYAPVPSPEAGAAGITLRWAAPAAALAIASAVVVGRALRRRRP
ncbi:SRPBCC domain-containing protein [Streptomyces sp. NPDC012486]|uniref:Carbon monoxide dehydrogenase subunit G n=1 Tax=Streptomyces pratensis (strain ATCC 33331 / IAF-45CD) TaxID=591167 RepID=A0A8D3WGR7_STRFA|nr:MULTISPECIES: SRPBCC domain-containing protein [Streptomyces]MYT52146.1 carbon monoxide dehydrogenase [Streptomyces sp. SID7815]WJY32367.1 SRPBCC domain-containing protein [Streptomyces sp. P9-2B-1]WKV79255.1 carbon monoxide dehydrogenase [Streptomyces sp. SNU607]